MPKVVSGHGYWLLGRGMQQEAESSTTSTYEPETSSSASGESNPDQALKSLTSTPSFLATPCWGPSQTPETPETQTQPRNPGHQGQIAEQAIVWKPEKWHVRKPATPELPSVSRFQSGMGSLGCGQHWLGIICVALQSSRRSLTRSLCLRCEK